jgi:beta-phosphoglucomutase-like phosphatase (HAD superfamily)
VATRNLSQTGLLDHVQVLVTRDLVRQGKPHPESYLLAATRLAAEPADCLALEDSHHGARAAIAAGMATILVPDLVPATAEIAAQCLHVARDLHEVCELLGQL